MPPRVRKRKANGHRPAVASPPTIDPTLTEADLRAIADDLARELTPEAFNGALLALKRVQEQRAVRRAHRRQMELQRVKRL